MIRIFLIASIFILTNASLYAQSAWLRPIGETYLQFSTTGIFNYDSQFFDGNDEYTLDTEGTDLTFQLYGEYGLTEKTTLIANIPLKYLDFKESENNIASLKSTNEAISDLSSVQFAKGGKLTGLSNMEFGFRHLILKKKLIVSGQFMVMANSIQSDVDKGLRTGYDAMALKPGVSIGYSQDKYYSQAYLGFEYFNNDYSDRIKAYLEAGYKFKNRLWLIGYLDILASLKNGDYDTAPEVWAGLYLNDQEYIGIGIKVIYEVNDKLGVTFNPGGAISANHLPKSPAITFGVFSKF